VEIFTNLGGYGLVVVSNPKFGCIKERPELEPNLYVCRKWWQVGRIYVVLSTDTGIVEDLLLNYETPQSHWMSRNMISMLQVMKRYLNVHVLVNPDG